MGKGNELWDDSALVDAFDRAVSSFKEAHFQAGASVEDEKKTTHGAEDKDESTECKISDEGTYQDDKAASKEQIQDVEPIKGGVENSYDELLKQYYELEEKRQSILQQIYAHPSYYDQTVQPDVSHATPEHAVQDPQYLNPLCAGYCLPVPVLPMTGGNGCGPYNSCFTSCQICDKCPENHAGCTIAVPCLPGLTNQSCGTDLKKGMMVAESAMRASNANTSGKESETVATSDADLVPVLNAWYSAGFHTGRYLLEKSQQNNT
ncbi:uncharacterized protein LOC144558639 [Carex rostrata]